MASPYLKEIKFYIYFVHILVIAFRRVGRQHMYIKPLMPTGIPANVPLMPQYFKDAGYTTHAVGKWHLGFCHQNYTPTYRGFDSFYGFYLGAQVQRPTCSAGTGTEVTVMFL